MIELKNIKIDGNIVKCEIYPEDSKTSGYIEVDVLDNKIINCVLPCGYEWCKNHLEHAKKYIVKHFREIKTIHLSRKMIMWY